MVIYYLFYIAVGKKIIIIKHARVCFYFNVVVSINKLSNISHASLKSYLSEVGAARQGLEHRQSLGGGGGAGGHCPPRSEPIDLVRSMNTKIFSHCLILFALSYFNEYVKA